MLFVITNLIAMRADPNELDDETESVIRQFEEFYKGTDMSMGFLIVSGTGGISSGKTN